MPVQANFQYHLMNKCVVISGASRGIGLAMVDQLAKRSGYTVYALSRNIEALTARYREHPNVHVVPFDLTIAIEAQLKPIIDKTTQIDVLINNAGHLEKGDFCDLSMDVYQRSLAVNFLGPVALTKYLFPKLKAGKAHVVNISTMGAYQGSVKFPGLTAYASAKAAITNFTEVFAEEQKSSGIRMNCLCLGAVNTDMLRTAFPGYEASTSAEEMASFILHFALESGLMFNGKVLPVSNSTP